MLVVQCLTEGLPLNVAVRTHGTTFKTVLGGEECSIHPSSALFGKILQSQNSSTRGPTWQAATSEEAATDQRVLFSELVRTSK